METSMTTRTDANDTLIHAHTHRDYRGTIDGKRAIMIDRNGSQNVRICDLADAEYTHALASAQARAARGQKPY
jgi:hypothetical protein